MLSVYFEYYDLCLNSYIASTFVYLNHMPESPFTINMGQHMLHVFIALQMNFNFIDPETGLNFVMKMVKRK